MILKFLLTLQIFFFYSRSTRSLENIAGSRFIDQANIRTVVRAGGISENLVGQLGMWWALVAPLFGLEFKLICQNLEGKCPHPVPPALVVERKLDIDQSNHYSPLNSVSCLPCRLKREKQIPVLQKSQKTRPNFPYVSFSIFFTNCQKSILGYRHDGRWS
jgi:hypothetical protein